LSASSFTRPESSNNFLSSPSDMRIVNIIVA
jgi:hypothetical protein